MDSIQFKTRITVEVDDSLNAHGGIGVDFWRVAENGCLIEMFTLDVEQAKQLMEWLFKYLVVYGDSK